MYNIDMENNIPERVATLEANINSMEKSLTSLATSIDTLNTKLDAFSNKFSTSAGIFISIVFIIEFVVVPFIVGFLFKRH